MALHSGSTVRALDTPAPGSTAQNAGTDRNIGFALGALGRVFVAHFVFRVTGFVEPYQLPALPAVADRDGNG